MKRWLAIGLTATLSLCQTHAQEKHATPTPPKQEIEVQSPLAPKPATTGTTNLITPPKDLIKYGGLATDIKRSTNRWKMFSLRKPLDPKTDEATLIRETRTEAAKPIKLFSIDF
jgi:hypothetical protein